MSWVPIPRIVQFFVHWISMPTLIKCHKSVHHLQKILRAGEKNCLNTIFIAEDNFYCRYNFCSFSLVERTFVHFLLPSEYFLCHFWTGFKPPKQKIIFHLLLLSFSCMFLFIIVYLKLYIPVKCAKNQLISLQFSFRRYALGNSFTNDRWINARVHR